MLSLPKQSVKCFLNADLNGQLELDTKEPQRGNGCKRI